MASRREQLQDYQFLSGRLHRAVFTADANSVDLPFRQFGVALLAGLAVGVILLAVVGVNGLLKPRSDNGWRERDRLLVVDAGSGARYLYLGGTLHPVPNLASARLALNAAGTRPVVVASGALAAVPRGAQVGIAGAPDDLPDRTRLVGGPWTACSTTAAQPFTSLLLSQPPAAAVALGDDALVVEATGPTGGRQLLWHGRRYPVPDPATLIALGLVAKPALPVGDALLATIPTGPALTPVHPAGDGAPGPSIDGRRYRIGQVFTADGRYYLLVADGLAPIGAVTARLLLGTASPVAVSRQQLRARLTNVPVEPSGFPDTAPAVHSAAVEAVCAVIDGQQPVRLLTYAQPPAAPAGGQAPDRSADFDRIMVAPGHGALIEAAADGAADVRGRRYLLTEQGIRYELLGNGAVDAAAALGYGGIRATTVPADLVSSIPEGPALDPDAVRPA